MIALAQPILGTVIYIASKSAGRNAVMGALLVGSCVMIRSRFFSRTIAYAGILASVLLLVGDISVGIVHSSPIAALTAIGYVLFIAWLLVIGMRLVRLGRNVL